MILLPPDASRQDIDQWCNRSVILMNVDGEWRPVYYQGLDGNRGVIGLDLRTRQSRAAPHTSCAVDWPLCGSVNLPKFAVHTVRSTLKQFRRSWTQACLKITIPRLWDVARVLRTFPSGVTTETLDLATACFFPEYPSVEEAHRLIATGERPTVAVTRNVIIAGDPSGKRLFYYNGEIAASSSDGVFYPIGSDHAIRRVEKVIGGIYRAA